METRDMPEPAAEAPSAGATQGEQDASDDAVESRIEGVVRDTDGEPVPQASVFIRSLQMGAATDPNGEFVLIGVPEGEHTIECQQGQVSGSAGVVEVESGELLSISCTLNP